MLIGSYFKTKRIEKGLSEADLASLISPDFQESLLWDFESGDDTDIDGWPIQDFKKYCKILDITPSDYATIPVSNLNTMPLSTLVKTRREEMGYSIYELSELIGFEENVIKAIEEEREETIVALAAIKHLSLTLGIPLRVLLDKI
jgi:ribosome-binding protein aMBF1 (putative translation factor)